MQGASLEDWPIRYRDLEPYYTKAEQELGVSGLAGANPFESSRSAPYPLPPLPVKASGKIFEAAAKQLRLHPFPAPMAIISQPYRGRTACVQCPYCKGYGCEVRAKSSSLATVIPLAERSGRRGDPGGLPGPEDRNWRGRPRHRRSQLRSARQGVMQRARTVVVCANGAESPRLLLISKSKRFAQGLGNSNGLVGRYFMVDTGVSVQALFEDPLYDYKGLNVSRVIHDYHDSDAKRGFYGGGGIDARFDEAGFVTGSWARVRVITDVEKSLPGPERQVRTFRVYIRAGLRMDLLPG